MAWSGACTLAGSSPENLFEIRKRIVGEEGHQVLSITQRGIKVKDIESNDGQLSMDYSKYQIVHPGDFAMNHMDLLTGFVDISAYSGVTSPDYRVFAVRDGVLCEPRYFLYLLQNAYRQKIFYAFGQGASEFGRWRFPTDQFNDFRFPSPRPSEQAAIATFLDRETGKIDALIAKQERLLALLAEKRQAIISHAVTKGLNPDAPMKDSGVTSLGEVPVHWKLKPMRYVSHLNPSISFDGCGEDDELTFLPMEQIKGGYHLPNTAPLAKCNSSYSCFDRGDILLAKVTPCFENGNIAIAAAKGFGTSEIFVLRAQNFQPRALYWYLQSAYFKMDGAASMTGAGGLKEYRQMSLDATSFPRHRMTSKSPSPTSSTLSPSNSTP